GFTVPLEYDPLLSKLIAYGATREEAVARVLRAVDEYFIGGIRHNLPLFRRVLRDPDFIAARIDTGYLDRLLASPKTQHQAGDETELAAIAAVLFDMQNGGADVARNGRAAAADARSPWKRAGREEGLRP